MYCNVFGEARAMLGAVDVVGVMDDTVKRGWGCEAAGRAREGLARQRAGGFSLFIYETLSKRCTSWFMIVWMDKTHIHQVVSLLFIFSLNE